MSREGFTGKEKKIEKPESIPVIPVSLLGQNDEIDRKIERITFNLMEGVSASVGDLEKPATAVDLQEPSFFLRDEELLKWAENIIGVDLNKEGKNASEIEELEEIYKKINDAYQKAKVFLVRVLKYNENEIFKIEPTTLDSKENLLNILKKIKIVKGDNGGLGQSIKYCRLIKATMATFETTKHDAEFLEKLTSHFESSLISDGDEIPLRFVGNHRDGIEFMAQDTDDYVIDGVLASRPKEFDGVVLRYLVRPESNAETALEDGIGVRIIIDKKQALRLIPILFEWFTKKMNMDVIDIENGNFFTKEQEADLKRRLSGAEDSFNFKENSLNGVSAGNFKSLRLKGHLSFSEKDASVVIRSPRGNTKTHESISIHARKFEIQLVDPENENEKNEGHHSVYYLKKLITARTRLDGWCPKTEFDQFVNQASFDSGMTSDEIRGFVLGKHAENPSIKKRIARKAPIVELKLNKRKIIYLAFSIYERWKKLGLISTEFFAKIEAARKYLDLD